MAQVNPCVQNCPQRSVLCHAGCEAYNEYHKQREAEMKRRAQKIEDRLAGGLLMLLRLRARAQLRRAWVCDYSGGD